MWGHDRRWKRIRWRGFTGSRIKLHTWRTILFGSVMVMPSWFSRPTPRRRRYRKWWHQDWQRELWVTRHCHFISHHVEWSLHSLSLCKMSLQINKRQDLHLQQSKIMCRLRHMNDFGGAQWNRDVSSSEADHWKVTNCRQNDPKTLSTSKEYITISIYKSKRT